MYYDVNYHAVQAVFEYNFIWMRGLYSTVYAKLQDNRKDTPRKTMHK